MIALAGILVRNSILLVDFISHSLADGLPLAATMGAFFIVDDSNFSGLVISAILGILVPTVLTLLVIPLLYYAVLRRKNYAAVSALIN